MDYCDWRNAVFNQPIRDIADADYESDAFFLSLEEAFDHINRALMDDGLYSLVPPLSMDYLCFNFWDRFSLFPSAEIGFRATHAGLDVMESALALPNDNIIVAAVEALCCWKLECTLDTQHMKLQSCALACRAERGCWVRRRFCRTPSQTRGAC